jgi:hypothetical protein
MNGEWKETRAVLRHAITEMFPTFTSSEMFSALKRTGKTNLRLSDLESICTSAGLGVEYLPRIFSPYGVYSDVIPRKKFIQFIDDEVTGKAMVVDFRDGLTDTQAAILSKFCRAIRSRRVHPSPLPRQVMSEPNCTAQLWSRVTRMSTTKDKVTTVRIASLCHIASLLNLTFSGEELIDALFAFLGVKCEVIDFTQFTKIFQAF